MRADLPTTTTDEALQTGGVGGTGVRSQAVNALHLVQMPFAPPTSAPATSSLTGQVRYTSDGAVWFCTAGGTPGMWRKLVGTTTAGAFHLLPTPVRVYDSRPNGLPLDIGPKQPLPAGNVAREVDLTANGSGVPAGATGAVVTVLLVNATPGAGNFTIWAGDKLKPLATTLVWGGDAGRFNTLAMTALSSYGSVRIDASLQTNVALDVVGYYR